jgi:hypothetical protein
MTNKLQFTATWNGLKKYYLEVKQGDQKVPVHMMITVQNTYKYFKQFQSLTVIT